jgi:hypothetical protein
VVPVEALQENAAWSAASRFSRGDPHSVDALDGCLQSSLARLRLGGVGHLRRFHPHALHICCPIFGPGRPALARGLGRKDRDLRSPVNFGHGTAVCARTLGKSRGHVRPDRDLQRPRFAMYGTGFTLLAGYVRLTGQRYVTALCNGNYHVIVAVVPQGGVTGRREKVDLAKTRLNRNVCRSPSGGS